MPYLSHAWTEASFTERLKMGLDSVRRSQGFSVDALRDRIAPTARPPRSTMARLFDPAHSAESSHPYLVFLVLDALGVSIQEVLEVGERVLDGSRERQVLDDTVATREDLLQTVARWIPTEEEYELSGRWIVDAIAWESVLGDWAKLLSGLGEDLTNGEMREWLRRQSDSPGIRVATLVLALNHAMGGRRARALCQRTGVRTFESPRDLETYLRTVDQHLITDQAGAALAMLTKRSGPVKGVSATSGSRYLHLRSLSLGESHRETKAIMMRAEVVQHVTALHGIRPTNAPSYEEYVSLVKALANRLNSSPTFVEAGIWRFVRQLSPTAAQ